MSSGVARVPRAPRVLALVLVAVGTASIGAQELPPGAGVEVVRAKCTACHAADLIVSQRLSPPGWTRELDKMVRWGAVLTEGERAAIQQYLEAHFPASRTARASPGAGAGGAASARASAGAAVFERACRGCHERDLVESQRLTRAGWQREVEKMMRWGATLSEDDKTALVDYLAVHYPWR